MNNDEGFESYCQILASMTYVASLEYLNEKPFLKEELYGCNVYYAMAAKVLIAGT
jgi:hypothetical protein